MASRAVMPTNPPRLQTSSITARASARVSSRSPSLSALAAEAIASLAELTPTAALSSSTNVLCGRVDGVPASSMDALPRWRLLRNREHHRGGVVKARHVPYVECDLAVRLKTRQGRFADFLMDGVQGIFELIV